MANHPSALKRHRQSLKRRARNKHVKSGMRTLIKEVRTASGKEEAEKALTKVVSAIDKAASKGVLHRRTASRYVSRLSHAVKSLDMP